MLAYGDRGYQLFSAKPLGCYGDGGMIFTKDQEIYKTLVSIRAHGKGTDKYDSVRIGINGRLDTVQAAILLAKFQIFNEEIALREQVSSRYAEGLRDVCQVPHVGRNSSSAWAQYSIIHPQRDEIADHLKKAGIPTAIYYPKPLHLQKAFSSLAYREGDFPNSEEISRNIISLPMHPYLEVTDQERIIQAVREIIS